MSKKKNDRIKLPKTLMGVKLPKQSRREVNRLLKNLPASTAKPLIATAVGAIATILAERLDQPLKTLIESGERRLKQSRAAKPAGASTH